MDILVSVIVPVYNVAPFLRKCIDYIIVQSFADFELLLIDDGSQDESANICDEYALKDDRIRVIHQVNAGVTAARRRGVEAARGNWLCFVDGDDMLPKNALWDLYNNSSAGVDIVIGSQFYMVDEQGKKIREICGQSSLGDWNNIDFLKALLEGKTPLSVCGKLYCRDLFDSSVLDLPKSIPYGEDYIMNVRLGNKAKQIAVTTSIVYNYFDRPGSCMNTFIPTLQYEKQFEKYLVATLGPILNSKEIKESLFYHRYAVIKTLYLTNKKLDTNDTYITELIKNTQHINLSKEDNIIRHFYKHPRLAKTSLGTLRILHNLKKIIRPS